MITKLTQLIISGCLLHAGLTSAQTLEIPLAGNAFITQKAPDATTTISREGLTKWNSTGSIASTYFRVDRPGQIILGIKAKSGTSGSSTLKVSLNGISKNVTINSSAFSDYNIGTFNISKPGYIKVDIQGITKNNNTFGDVSHITATGDALSGKNIFSNDPAYYYWARRGPSCHLGYTLPNSEDINYFYNEVTIPKGEDKIGSYFMANGFGEGYFGMQVNSENERRILFSVWSPFKTDNPKEIPDDHKITLNKVGQQVKTGEFGNEGSGGQSYMKYNWSAGKTYKFLLKGQPDSKGNTDYTAWFFALESKEWKLIASWKRPQTNTYLKGFYSFVENFNPENGYMHRKAEFHNQWVRTASGKWLPVSSAKFTVDATYKAQQRIDAMGGTNGKSFFLTNGGFFNTITTPGTLFSVQTPKQAPVIDFEKLP
ncbi:DUF3472 domain-containing protein [Elizabethkingia bruuniana]|uniref:DUF3472 domain-containing protein n=1 Tax=Elizabethkingia bruuniana TaxID=1756149 RepID=UPI00241CDA34|nr:DUF3472 domain-containing protein [Elizabethkingia bruuniana]